MSTSQALQPSNDKPNAYVVQPGDTLWDLAVALLLARGGPADDVLHVLDVLAQIVHANPELRGTDLSLIQPGQLFVLPEPEAPRQWDEVLEVVAKEVLVSSGLPTDPGSVAAIRDDLKEVIPPLVDPEARGAEPPPPQPPGPPAPPDPGLPIPPPPDPGVPIPSPPDPGVPIPPPPDPGSTTTTTQAVAAPTTQADGDKGGLRYAAAKGLTGCGTEAISANSRAMREDASQRPLAGRKAISSCVAAFVSRLFRQLELPDKARWVAQCASGIVVGLIVGQGRTEWRPNWSRRDPGHIGSRALAGCPADLAAGAIGRTHEEPESWRQYLSDRGRDFSAGGLAGVVDEVGVLALMKKFGIERPRQVKITFDDCGNPVVHSEWYRQTWFGPVAIFIGALETALGAMLSTPLPPNTPARDVLESVRVAAAVAAFLTTFYFGYKWIKNRGANGGSPAVAGAPRVGAPMPDVLDCHPETELEVARIYRNAATAIATAIKDAEQGGELPAHVSSGQNTEQPERHKRAKRDTERSLERVLDETADVLATSALNLAALPQSERPLEKVAKFLGRKPPLTEDEEDTRQGHAVHEILKAAQTIRDAAHHPDVLNMPAIVDALLHIQEMLEEGAGVREDLMANYEEEVAKHLAEISQLRTEELARRAEFQRTEVAKTANSQVTELTKPTADPATGEVEAASFPEIAAWRAEWPREAVEASPGLAADALVEKLAGSGPAPTNAASQAFREATQAFAEREPEETGGPDKATAANDLVDRLFPEAAQAEPEHDPTETGSDSGARNDPAAAEDSQDGNTTENNEQGPRDSLTQDGQRPQRDAQLERELRETPGVPDPLFLVPPQRDPDAPAGELRQPVISDHPQGWPSPLEGPTSHVGLDAGTIAVALTPLAVDGSTGAATPFRPDPAVPPAEGEEPEEVEPDEGIERPAEVPVPSPGVELPWPADDLTSIASEVGLSADQLAEMSRDSGNLLSGATATPDYVLGEDGEPWRDAGGHRHEIRMVESVDRDGNVVSERSICPENAEFCMPEDDFVTEAAEVPLVIGLLPGVGAGVAKVLIQGGKKIVPKLVDEAADALTGAGSRTLPKLGAYPLTTTADEAVIAGGSLAPLGSKLAGGAVATGLLVGVAGPANGEETGCDLYNPDACFAAADTNNDGGLNLASSGTADRRVAEGWSETEIYQADHGAADLEAVSALSQVPAEITAPTLVPADESYATQDG